MTASGNTVRRKCYEYVRSFDISASDFCSADIHRRSSEIISSEDENRLSSIAVEDSP